jgi:hypothetical protein
VKIPVFSFCSFPFVFQKHLQFDKKNTLYYQLFFALFLVCLSLKSNAQRFVYLKTDVIVGELKSLDGVGTIETD